ncbi:hypothetical protein [Microcoleus sp. F10-D1]|uniref:hypothetical protein n=1 Tax=Microcoleus sp. F10-D1 TaxID=2818758 RepID=UPI002FD76278
MILRGDLYWTLDNLPEVRLSSNTYFPSSECFRPQKNYNGRSSSFSNFAIKLYHCFKHRQDTAIDLLDA